MPGALRMARRMALRRVVTTVCPAALLARAQVHPLGADLHALVALVQLGGRDRVDRSDVCAGIRHGRTAFMVTRASPPGAAWPDRPRPRRTDRGDDERPSRPATPGRIALRTNGA